MLWAMGLQQTGFGLLERIFDPVVVTLVGYNRHLEFHIGKKRVFGVEHALFAIVLAVHVRKVAGVAYRVAALAQNLLLHIPLASIAGFVVYGLRVFGRSYEAFV